MEKINYIIGDATNPRGQGNKLIVHICNNEGAWGAGFVLAISQKWKEPEKHYKEWFKTKEEKLPNKPRLGNNEIIKVEPDIWIANMIAQNGLSRSDNRPLVNYVALRKCLRKVSVFAKGNGVSVHMPRIGCGIAGGKWEDVEPIVLEELCRRGVDVTVYDLK